MRWKRVSLADTAPLSTNEKTDIAAKYSGGSVAFAGGLGGEGRELEQQWRGGRGSGWSLRTACVSYSAGTVGRFAGSVSRPHDQAFRAAWTRKRRILDADGRSG